MQFLCKRREATYSRLNPCETAFTFIREPGVAGWRLKPAERGAAQQSCAAGERLFPSPSQLRCFYAQFLKLHFLNPVKYGCDFLKIIVCVFRPSKNAVNDVSGEHKDSCAEP